MDTENSIYITDKQKKIKEILDISFQENLGHIPSALSLLKLLDYLSKSITHKDKIFIGKPFGAQAYEVMRKDFPEGAFPERLGSILYGTSMMTVNIDNSLGHTLSKAIGYAYANPEIKVYVIMGDAGCLEGTFLEGLSIASELRLDNLTLLIDVNQMGVTEKIKDPFMIKYLLIGANWSLNNNQEGIPTAILFHSFKGAGIPFMENDPLWHYKKLSQETYKKALLSL